MRNTTRHLAVLALGTMAFLWSTATTANADGFGNYPAPLGGKQSAECETTPNIGVSGGLFISPATGEDTYITTCDNRRDRAPAKQRLKCETNPTSGITIVSQADRTFHTNCSNIAGDHDGKPAEHSGR